jgi:hypothetical protein
VTSEIKRWFFFMYSARNLTRGINHDKADATVDAEMVKGKTMITKAKSLFTVFRSELRSLLSSPRSPRLRVRLSACVAALACLAAGGGGIGDHVFQQFDTADVFQWAKKKGWVPPDAPVPKVTPMKDLKGNAGVARGREVTYSNGEINKNRSYNQSEEALQDYERRILNFKRDDSADTLMQGFKPTRIDTTANSANQAVIPHETFHVVMLGAYPQLLQGTVAYYGDSSNVEMQKNSKALLEGYAIVMAYHYLVEEKGMHPDFEAYLNKFCTENYKNFARAFVRDYGMDPGEIHKGLVQKNAEIRQAGRWDGTTKVQGTALAASGAAQSGAGDRSRSETVRDPLAHPGANPDGRASGGPSSADVFAAGERRALAILQSLGLSQGAINEFYGDNGVRELLKGYSEAALSGDNARAQEYLKRLMENVQKPATR